MGSRASGVSPRALSRLGGFLYLVIIVVGLFDEAYVRGNVIVSGDAAATAARLRSMESLWRAGIAAEMLLLVCAVGVLWILYVLLRPVSRDLALLAALFNVVAIAIEAVITLDLVAALFPLGNAGYLRAFEPGQLDALATLALRGHGPGFGVSLIFFGCFCVVTGTLIFRSGYMPKVIGVLMALAGACYLVNSFALLLSPALASRLFPAILAPAFIGEASLCLWLLLRGVSPEKWKARVSADGARAAAAAS